ncbi:ABC transporter ATP-binding protein [Desulfatitalea alkaliphila]|uniref:ABC transporter ATP-binding protein n=1 Tax=Desulfatitalea alkaliphila TaxID=2929485 RepID=A0AA41UN35_9BACT|nr:ABC transporter ATP-binding protein [Desulfatitalea alkaliphila]MCJ8499153.1 ABC transporter ATP-binding protein [Desulfatitalea alkaliphila]
MADAIALERLGHAYEGRAVLQDLSVQVPCGRFFVIIGPNGSGKTTLLKLMAHLLPLQKGHLTVMGRAVGRFGARQLARTIAYVPQSVPATFAFTVFQVVMMGRAPHLGMLGIEGAKDLDLGRQAMQLAGVADLAERRLDQLSGGERQRVFIARAICQQPAIMLLDEPTAALDPAHQVRVMDLMERLKTEQGITVVMVSHDLNLAAMYADLVLLLHKGHTAGLGPPGKVLDYAILEEVYGCPLVVDKSPLGDYPRVHLVPGRYMRTP